MAPETMSASASPWRQGPGGLSWLESLAGRGASGGGVLSCTREQGRGVSIVFMEALIFFIIVSKETSLFIKSVAGATQLQLFQ